MSQQQMTAKGGSPSLCLRKGLEGDQSAYREFLEWASDYTRMLVRKRLQGWTELSKDHAEDIAQEVLLAIHNKRHTYISTLPVEAWITGIVRFKAIDWLRSRAKSRKDLSLDDIQHLDFETELQPSASNQADAAKDLGKMLSGLPEKQRAVVQLTKIDGLSVAETAQRLGMFESSVKVTVHRALVKLKTQVQRRQDDSQE